MAGLISNQMLNYGPAAAKLAYDYAIQQATAQSPAAPAGMEPTGLPTATLGGGQAANTLPSSSPGYPTGGTVAGGGTVATGGGTTATQGAATQSEPTGPTFGTYDETYGSFIPPQSDGYPDWVTDDYLRSVYDAGYDFQNGVFTPRARLKDNAQQAAQQVEAILRSEYDKAVASGDPEVMAEYQRQRQQALDMFNNEYVDTSTTEGFKPMTPQERQAAAQAAYNQLSQLGGLTIGGLNASGALPSFAQLTGVDDGSKMDFDAVMQQLSHQAPQAAPQQQITNPLITMPPGAASYQAPQAGPSFDIAGGGYDQLKKAYEDYKTHGNVLTDTPGLDMSKYTALLSQADAAKGSDIGKTLMSQGAGGDAEKSKGLVANAMGDYFAGNIHKVTAKNKPLEYSGPVAGKSTVKGIESGTPAQTAPVAPLQTPTLSRRAGIVGARM